MGAGRTGQAREVVDCIVCAPIWGVCGVDQAMEEGVGAGPWSVWNTKNTKGREGHEEEGDDGKEVKTDLDCIPFTEE